MNKPIYTNENKLRIQTDYNTTWAKKVNEHLEMLQNLCGKLTDEQLRTFLVNPEALGNEMVAKARADYEKWLQGAPSSVKTSLSFNDGGIVDKVKSIHRKLNVHKPPVMRDETEILNGACVLSEEGKQRLLESCSVYGGDKRQKVYELSCKAAEVLNELHRTLREYGNFENCVESAGRWRGFIGVSDDKKTPYTVNADLLTLIEE